MATESFANNAATSLTAALTDATGTSLSVASTVGFPSSGNYRILVDNELMLVTGGQGTTTWTVTRAAEGTAGATHVNGSNVTHVLTAGALDQFRADGCAADLAANLPAAAKAGRIFLPTDGYYLFRDSGSGWPVWGPIAPLTEPPGAGTFTQVNCAGTGLTADNPGGALRMAYNANTGIQTSTQLLVKAAHSTPYTLTVRVAPTVGFYNTQGAGVAWRESSSGKLMILGPAYNAGMYMAFQELNSPSSWNSTPEQWSNVPPSTFPWLRLADDGTNRRASVSTDGLNWVVIWSGARTAFITPDQYGLWLQSASSGFDTSTGTNVGITCYSWLEN